MSEHLQPLFEAVRAACSTADWSRGVELSRAGAVVGEGGDDEELSFRISAQGGMLSTGVKLFPEDLDCNRFATDPP